MIAGVSSTNMVKQKVTRITYIQKKEPTIISSRMMNIGSVTELNHTLMEEYIEESSKISTMTVMDSLSIRITMSMMVNGIVASNTERECSGMHQLEELKEDYMKWIKSKKSLKSYSRVTEHHRRRKPAIKSRLSLNNF